MGRCRGATEIGSDPALGCLLIRGEGENFCAGGDIRGFSELLQQAPQPRREGFARRMEALKTLVETFVEMELPVVAACQGGVAGAGLTYALGADVVVAAETVRFMFAHQRWA